MSGHSKWANIKHKKAKEDSKRGKVFTALIKKITLAARNSTGDPHEDPHVKMLIEKAKYVNMPQDNILRAIKKGSGTLDGVSYEEVVYEGYGPAGTAAIVEVLTDNKKRTVAELRHLFSKSGGNLAETGAVSWMFERKGIIRAAGTLTEDELLEKLIDFDIENISCEDNLCTITCDYKNLDSIKKAVEETGIKVEDAKIEWVAKDALEISEDDETKVFNFLEALEELDDVNEVYSNIG